VKQDSEAFDVLRFYTELQQRSSVAACSALFKNAVARFGMVAFACGELNIADRDRSVLFTTEWQAAPERDWSRALVVHVARGSTRYGIVTMIGPGEPLDEFQRDCLCLISECLLSRIRALRENLEEGMLPAGLSRREVETARLVAMGYSDPEIAAVLGISRSTARRHVDAGRRRLNARNRAHLAALSVSLGIATLA
jgi:DNA-binding CsgD family transcriptional regulator